MKIALVIAPSFSTHNLPVGLGTVATVLRGLGQEVKVFDLNILCWHRFQQVYGADWKQGHPLFWDDQTHSAIWEKPETDQEPLPPEVVSVLQDVMGPVLAEDFDVLGFSLFATNRKVTHFLARLYRERHPSTRLLFGGPSVTDIALNRGVADLDAVRHWVGPRDGAVAGEGESALPPLLSYWNAANQEGDLPAGVIAYCRGALGFGGPSVPCDLARTPMYDLEDFDPNAYANGTIPVEICRGCVGRCTFCNERNLHKGYRTRPVEVVLDILTRAIRRGFRRFTFMGSAINGDHAHFSELITAIAARNERIWWGGSIRFDPRMDEQFVQTMGRAGCFYVNFGLESASPAVLEKIRKKADVGAVEEFLRLAFAAKIRVAMNVIAGFPGETEADHQQTVAFLRRVGKFLYRVHVSPCQIYEGTTLDREPARYGVLELDRRTQQDEWMTQSLDNTPSIRRGRVEEIVRLLDQLRVPWLAPFSSEHRSELQGGFVSRVVGLRRRVS